MNKTSWRDVTEAELAATGKVKRGTTRIGGRASPDFIVTPEGATLAPEARSKYGAVRTEVDGISFHSAKEAARYAELKFLEKAGEISELELQPRYDLSVSGVKLGEYRGDFRYWERRDLVQVGDKKAIFRIVEDVKGFKTPLYKWKKKHMLAEHGIQIREL